MYSLTGPSGARINYNSDLSEVEMYVDRSRIDDEGIGAAADHDHRVRVELDVRDLIALVAEYVRQERISELEHATERALLGLEEK